MLRGLKQQAFGFVEFARLNMRQSEVGEHGGFAGLQGECVVEGRARRLVLAALVVGDAKRGKQRPVGVFEG